MSIVLRSSSTKLCSQADLYVWLLSIKIYTDFVFSGLTRFFSFSPGCWFVCFLLNLKRWISMRPEEHFLSVITDPITVRSPLSLISTRYPPRSHFKFRTLDSNPTSTGYEMLPLIYFKGQVSIRTNSKCLSRYIVLRYSVPFFVRTELSYLSRGVSHQLI